MAKPSILAYDDARIAYHRLPGASPGVMFLGGFRSDMTGTKAMALEEFCRERGQAFIRFDYEGHGQSSGAFEDGTIGRWADNALAVFTKLTKGPQLLVGSSMGGWIALLLAMQKQRRVAGLVGIAPAPDFTETLIWELLTEHQRHEIKVKGRVMVPTAYGEPYPITANLITEGRTHLLLHREIPVYCPVRLIHGMKDEDVPWEMSLAINEKLASQDVRTILVDNGDHRLSTQADIDKILKVTGKLLDALATPSTAPAPRRAARKA